MQNSNTGSLVISLDFELLWGVFDVVDFQDKISYFNNTRKVIPQILNSFEKHSIKATWATVGMLFNEDWNEWEQNIPDVIPNYLNTELSAYTFGKKIKSTSTEKLCFAPNLIKVISQSEGQEIGTHTYSHFYCLEAGQDNSSFKEDLQKAISLANKFDIQLQSLVFPRNQLKQEYLKICKGFGITNVRSNPDSWYWKNALSTALLTKVARTGDAYLPFGSKSYKISSLTKKGDLPMEQKASRFLRPVEINGFLRKAKITRILKEMEDAAKNGEFYHLWWHPHNFGDAPDRSMEDLNIILGYFQKLRSKFGFRSENMAGMGIIASQIEQNH